MATIKHLMIGQSVCEGTLFGLSLALITDLINIIF